MAMLTSLGRESRAVASRRSEETQSRGRGRFVRTISRISSPKRSIFAGPRPGMDSSAVSDSGSAWSIASITFYQLLTPEFQCPVGTCNM